jgi:hypothetical protein
MEIDKRGKWLAIEQFFLEWARANGAPPKGSF